MLVRNAAILFLLLYKEENGYVDREKPLLGVPSCQDRRNKTGFIQSWICGQLIWEGGNIIQELDSQCIPKMFSILLAAGQTGYFGLGRNSWRGRMGPFLLVCPGPNLHGALA